jgi:hypothetical protein
MTSRNRSTSSTTRCKTSATAPASPDYPQGPRSISFADLHEDDWWALLHALEVRIRYFEQQRSGMERLHDPGLQRQIEHCDDTLQRLRSLLHCAQQQISPAFFSRRTKPSD